MCVCVCVLYVCMCVCGVCVRERERTLCVSDENVRGLMRVYVCVQEYVLSCH